MALIDCKECGRKVSDLAVSCPGCGAPVSGEKESRTADSPLITIQETSKKFKLHTLGAIALIIIGIIGIIIAAQSEELESLSFISTFIVLVGFTWYFINRVRIWWHHK